MNHVVLVEYIIVHEIEQIVNELHLYQFLQTAPELLKA